MKLIKCKKNLAKFSTNFCDFGFVLMQSKFGTFVNHLKVDEIELCVGDKISLVDILALLPHKRSEVSQLSFKVGHSFEPAEEMASVPLVSVTTRPEPSAVIVINSSDDEDDDEINKFADDYEMGEPSSKNIDEATSEHPKRVSEPIIPVSKVKYNFLIFLIVLEYKPKIFHKYIHIY